MMAPPPPPVCGPGGPPCGAPKFCPLCRWNRDRETQAGRSMWPMPHARPASPKETVMRVAKLLTGHLHGECVAMTAGADGCQGGDLVEFTVAPGMVPSFVSFVRDLLGPTGQSLAEARDATALERIRARHPVTVLPFPRMVPFLGVRVFELVPCGLVVLVGHHNDAFHALNITNPCAFDMHMLSMSQNRLYARDAAYSGSTNYGDSATDVAYHLSRTRLRQMSLLPLSQPVIAIDHAAFMCYALHMIADRGWHMDDACVGRNGWVLGRWSTMIQRPNSVRRGPAECAASLCSHHECPICFGDFLSGDFVINLPCNHNVHAICDMRRYTSSNDASIDGMCKWLSMGDNPTCPCCRTPIAFA